MKRPTTLHCPGHQKIIVHTQLFEYLITAAFLPFLGVLYSFTYIFSFRVEESQLKSRDPLRPCYGQCLERRHGRRWIFHHDRTQLTGRPVRHARFGCVQLNGRFGCRATCALHRCHDGATLVVPQGFLPLAVTIGLQHESCE